MGLKSVGVKDNDIKKIERYRWIVWLILASVYIFVTFHRMGVGVVKNDLQNEFKIGSLEYANIGSMYFYAYFIMQIPSGILADKLGPKKTVSMFSILAAIGSITFGMASSINVAYIGRFMVGIGVSVVFICLVKIQSRWFYSKNFALMVGLSGVVANLGSMLAQTPLALVSAKFGWRNTFIFMGLAMVFFTVLTLIFVKDDPKDMGLPGMDELENRPIDSSNIKVMPALKSILSNKRTWVISIAYFGLSTAYTVFMGTYGVSFLIEKYSLTNVQSANYVIVTIAGALISSLVLGQISDYFKSRKLPLTIAGTLTLLFWIVLIYVGVPINMLVPFLFIFGFVSSAFTMCWTMGNEVNDRRLSGMATGVVNCVGFLGAAVIPVIMGKVLDSYKDTPLVGYEKAYFVLIMIIAISVVASFFTKETNAQNIYDVK
ncbi:MFS transporter [Paraclostridium sordellii]|uniref:MFS transporter n=1 Tax=Paraclostridium sordellii TaxID=1505 RepID=UPI000316A69F|nr:MFS transporter [Paeniclostridium sordellii]EPZ56057.1 sugar (and other) transporter family protein [[Clostridium] sordellii VPI 9048] [Paeniclostridium sordellii VPI 9048]TAN64314.1 MFS transporter [Paeniclostridium sordellii 8483]CEK38204.1 glycerol-3-phosphate transporter [[Clostridium] sordellii] [Paeniclostridium sordellii]